jgi:hypothetical protein
MNEIVKENEDMFMKNAKRRQESIELHARWVAKMEAAVKVACALGGIQQGKVSDELFIAAAEFLKKEFAADA